MTDQRQDDIYGMFTRWLERYSPPLSMKDNERAQKDEVTALVSVIMKFAPPAGYAEFVASVLDQIEYQMKTRAWPTKGELGSVCSNLRKQQSASVQQDQGEERTEVEIIGAKMARGEPVGEGWVYGAGACALIAARMVDEPTMRKYRSGAFLARRQMYGEDAALQWEAERKAAHDAAREAHRQRDAERAAKPSYIPSKRDLPAWDGVID